MRRLQRPIVGSVCLAMTGVFLTDPAALAAAPPPSHGSTVSDARIEASPASGHGLSPAEARLAMEQARQARWAAADHQLMVAPFYRIGAKDLPGVLRVLLDREPVRRHLPRRQDPGKRWLTEPVSTSRCRRGGVRLLALWDLT
jgi:hypothetical protein